MQQDPHLKRQRRKTILEGTGFSVFAKFCNNCHDSSFVTGPAAASSCPTSNRQPQLQGMANPLTASVALHSGHVTYFDFILPYETGSHYAVLSGLELIVHLPASASQALGLKVCATDPSTRCIFISSLYRFHFSTSSSALVISHI